MVDHISVVYQTTSWHGEPCDPGLKDLLSDLVDKGLIDSTYYYEMPHQITQHPKFYETEKRNIGLQIAKMKACTHHMSMDTDEYYHKDEFKYMKKTLEEGDYDGGACGLYTYFKDPTFLINGCSNYYVSTIFKIVESIEYRPVNYPVLIDPTRRYPLKNNNLRVFQEDEVNMHHMSFIRKDLMKKFRNTSADSVHDNKAMLTNYILEYENYEVGQEIPLFKPLEEGERIETTIKVENYFNVPKF